MADATLPEQSSRRLPSAAASTLALVVVWSSAGRLGEVFLPPPVGSVVIGRGGPAEDDGVPRLLPVIQRPGRTTPSSPLGIEQLSRVQLELHARDGELGVRNRGRLPLSLNGAPCTEGALQAGDVLAVGQQLVLLVVHRPALLPLQPDVAVHPFGSADADGLVGESPAAWALRGAISFLGPRDGHVLVLGGSGTGKELVAQALHARSSRRGRPIVSRNAATIPEGLVDAELFGNLRGYPNPGMPDRPGLIGKASGATLFLDEFAELSHAVQAHLLRVLDAGEYQRLGEVETRRADFRLVAATNRPLSALKHDVAARFFLRLEAPALDARREDVPFLVRHYLRAVAERDPGVVARFRDGDEVRISGKWMAQVVRLAFAANVRELYALVWDAIGRSTGGTLGEGIALAPPAHEPSVPMHPVAVAASRSAEDDLTRERVQRCLDAHNGSIEQSWRELGLTSRFALGRLIRKLGVVVRREARGPSRLRGVSPD